MLTGKSSAFTYMQAPIYNPEQNTLEHFSYFVLHALALRHMLQNIYPVSKFKDS